MPSEGDLFKAQQFLLGLFREKLQPNAADLERFQDTVYELDAANHKQCAWFWRDHDVSANGACCLAVSLLRQADSNQHLYLLPLVMMVHS
jgi:hypothetical protein